MPCTVREFSPIIVEKSMLTSKRIVGSISTVSDSRESTELPNFTDRLRRLVDAAGGVAALARAAQIPVSSLRSYLTRSEPTRPILLKLSNLGIPLGWLMSGRGKEPDFQKIAARIASKRFVLLKGQRA